MSAPLKMHKEDILRAIIEFGRENGKSDVKAVLDDLGGGKRVFNKALSEMEDENLIVKKENMISLTSSGREVAEKIYEKHKFIEEYFSEVFNESNVHLLAHALEHCVSDSLLAKMRGELALVSETLTLSDLKTEEEATIIAIAVPDKKLFSRLLGVGLSPQSQVKLFEKLPGQLVIEVEGRKIALDKTVADKVILSRENRRVLMTLCKT